MWFITSVRSDLAVGARVSHRTLGADRLAALAAISLAVAAVVVTPAAAARRTPPAPVIRGPVIVTVSVGENATATMPLALWRKLAAEYVGGHTVGLEEGTAPADDARCRAAHARYAVLATFDRATRLPGLAQDTDRSYAVGRFTVRDCATGALEPTKTIALESDPLTPADRGGGIALDPDRLWARSVRATLAHNPLVLTSPAPK
ncbi:MAG: hypothetical protein ABI186_02115 [Candidatus Elarobacter sp.]